MLFLLLLSNVIKVDSLFYYRVMMWFAKVSHLSVHLSVCLSMTLMYPGTMGESN